MDLIPTESEFKTLQLIANHAGKSAFFTKLGGVDGILCISLMARELGISPMAALSGGIRYILGNVEVSPRLMNSMIRQRGHKMEILESTDTICTIKGTRKDTGESYTCTYSLQEAQKAGLVKKDGGWDKYPTDMLFARCLSRIARRLFADVIGPAYVEGETSDEVILKKDSPKEETISTETVEVKQETKVTELQIDFLRKMIDSIVASNPEDKDIEKIMLHSFGVDSLSDLSISQAKSMMIDLKKKTEVAS